MRESSESDIDRLRRVHMALLKHKHLAQEEQEILAPVFTMPPTTPETFSYSLRNSVLQYALLAGMTKVLEEDNANEGQSKASLDPRIFYNVTSPSSTFICGSQGSGKSHTLSCLLEGCLIPSDASNLPKALTGLVFHFDTFISDEGGSPCEAAFLASDPHIKVRVLCSPTNLKTIKCSYHGLDVSIEPLKIDQADLNTKRMMDLMAVTQDDGPVPLYIHTVYRVLRNMRLQQQEDGGGFRYDTFKTKLMDSGLSSAQLGPLNQRLETLESFMPATQIEASTRGKERRKRVIMGTDWHPKAGCLTIVDLSCPCITPETACSLFNICLSIFLEQNTDVGRVIALDEAHKFMTKSAEALTFTNTLLSTIRLQRHLGARIIISTQEPSISPALLDLSSVTIVHRFTSPEWLRSLRTHLAAAATDLLVPRSNRRTESHTLDEEVNTQEKIFHEIVGLKVGEALLFAPSGLIHFDLESKRERLGARYVKISVRSRLTSDGGESIIAGAS